MSEHTEEFFGDFIFAAVEAAMPRPLTRKQRDALRLYLRSTLPVGVS
jgi:hypothetical protein